MDEINSPYGITNHTELLSWTLKMVNLLEYDSNNVTTSELSIALKKFDVYINFGVGTVTENSSFVDKLKFTLGQVLNYMYLKGSIAATCYHFLTILDKELSEHQKNSIAHGIELDVLLNKSLS